MANIDAKVLKAMFINGANQLFLKHEKINALNVFPVPDGDTGTNMNFTIASGVKEIENKEFDTVYEVAKAFAKGCLMGARGNSGVILSQVFNGFAIGLKDQDKIHRDSIISAFQGAKEKAYGSVATPVEGTILTLIKDLAEKTKKVGYKSEAQFYKLITQEADRSVNNTPNLLPVLKEAGVVDSGAYGLKEIIHGMTMYLWGRIIDRDEVVETLGDNEWMVNDVHAEGEFGYCTEFIVIMNEENQKKVAKIDMFKELKKFGDSVAVVTDEEILKIHVHTELPEDAMKFAHQFGEFKTIKIENMQTQFDDLVDGKRKDVALVAVSAGKGMTKIFKERNVDHVVFGGQTMNPSIEDLIKAIKAANADKVIVLPNNSNIVLSAQQAADMLQEIEVKVIMAKTMPQGVAASEVFVPSDSFEENIEEMEEVISEVSTGEVSIAIKDTKMNGVEVKKDQYIAIIDGKIVGCEKTMIDAAKSLIDKFADKDMVKIIYGTEAKGEKDLAKYAEDKGLEVELLKGDQPVYPFVIGAE